jgi:hypothetical protein
MDVIDSLPPLVILVLGLLLVIWLVLFLLVPFMLESIRSWTRRSHGELAEINRKLDRIATLLDDQSADMNVLLDVTREGRADAKGRARDPRERVRKEPTIG